MTTQITLDDYWMGRDKAHPAELTDAIQEQAEQTVSRINLLLFHAVKAGVMLVAVNGRSLVASGWRPSEINRRTHGAAPGSHHITAQACDVADPRGDLSRWCLANQGILADVKLWLEHPSATPTWCHLQTVPPRSGHRVFYP